MEGQLNLAMTAKGECTRRAHAILLCLKSLLHLAGGIRVRGTRSQIRLPSGSGGSHN